MDKRTPLEPSDILIGGAPEGADAALVVDLVARADGPVIVVLRDDVRMSGMKAALDVTDPSLPVMTFPAWDCLPYDRISPNGDIAADRMARLAMLAKGWQKPSAFLTTINAATQYLPSRQNVAASVFSARVGERVNVDNLRGYLARMGYAQAPSVREPGEFAVRGGDHRHLSARSKTSGPAGSFWRCP